MTKIIVPGAIDAQAILNAYPNFIGSCIVKDGSTEVDFTSGSPGEDASVSDIQAAQVTYNSVKKWDAIREKRDALLAACDWMANSDVTMSDAWTTYRQALRDLPSQSDPDNVVFPTEPS